MEIRMAGGVFELGNPEGRGGGGLKHWKSSWRRRLKNRAVRRGGGGVWICSWNNPIQGVIGRVISNILRESQSWNIYSCEEKSLDELVSSIFLFQLKLDSIPGHYFFINFDCLSCAMSIKLISLGNGIWYVIFIGSLTVRLQAPGNRTVLELQ